MRILGPTDLLAAATTVRQGFADGTDQVRDLVDLVPRVIGMVDRAEDLLSRAEGLLDRAELAAERADAVAEAADRTRVRTDKVVARAEKLVGRTEALMVPVESLGPKALPLVDELVSSVSPEEIRAMKDLVDRLPSLVDQLDTVGPDVHNILDAVTDLSHALQGLPGMGAIKRRGERKDAEEDAQEGPENQSLSGGPAGE
ncbi:hypothetical protein GCM10027418_09290 [Mariniluteicoccus endophyticus]